jgi:hypothetical protein
LTHRYINKTSNTSQGEGAPDDLLRRDIVARLALFVSSGDASANSAAALQMVEDVVGERLSDLISASKELNYDIAECITSVILTPWTADPSVLFDDKIMQESFSSDGEEADKTVMCTTGLGLRRLTRKEDGTGNDTVLLRPQVVLHTVLGIFTPLKPGENAVVMLKT